MEDPDRIEIGYVFDEEPPVETYRSLFEAFPSVPGPDYGADEFHLSYWDDALDVNEVSETGTIDDVARVVSTYSGWAIEVPMERYEITVSSDRSGMGLLSGSSLPYVKFSTTVYAFDDEVEDEQNRTAECQREFVELLARAAAILRPKWGFGRRIGLAIGDDETVEELARTTTPPLYEYNVFRSETVDAIGRERVLSAPVWYVDELATGGVFLSVREPPRQCSRTAGTCQEVADHLGLELARTERYH